MQKLRIIVGGFIGVMPVGGVTWDYLQYPLGLALLGHDVYYIEDTRLYPIYQKPGSDWKDASGCVEHLQKVMEHFGFVDRWAYRDEASGNCFGMSEARVKQISASADVFINISCSTFLRDEYLKIPARILVDSDPMFTQIQYESQAMFTPGKPGLRQIVDGHNHHFTFGENVNEDDCRIPLCGKIWKPTRQPVCLSFWRSTLGSAVQTPSFTTLMNWSAANVLNYQNEEWGQKDVEFQKYFTVPQFVANATFSAVINKTGGTQQAFTKDKIEAAGWNVLDPYQCGGDWQAYQEFIDRSDAEFSVAKNTYVKGKTGWFSCRSACYLAMSKPVVTQDTGWSKLIPSGKGVLAFNDLHTAVECLQAVVQDYKQHAASAREVANAYFDSNKVLEELLSHL